MGFGREDELLATNGRLISVNERNMAEIDRAQATNALLIETNKKLIARIAQLEAQLESMRQRESFAAGNVGMHWAEERDTAVKRAESAEQALAAAREANENGTKLLTVVREENDDLHDQNMLLHWELGKANSDRDYCASALAAAREENEKLRGEIARLTHRLEINE